MYTKELIISEHVRKIKKWVEKGGPDEFEWEDFNKWIEILFHDKEKYEFTKEDMIIIQNAFGESIKVDTLQGRSINKPFGYPGDFLMIDRFYTYKTIDDKNFEKWDKLCLKMKGTYSLRNRKEYFIKLLLEKVKKYNSNFTVLNIASGPCRDLKEFFQIEYECNMKCDCLEQDLQAINYAKCVLNGYNEKVDFICKNAIKFYTDKKYDLIWSGGLFDYFTDKIFIRLLKRYYDFLNIDGEIVIGNFSPKNPSRNYMELFEWNLYYRDEEKLLELAKSCGFNLKYVCVDAEKENINLFLHIKRH